MVLVMIMIEKQTYNEIGILSIYWQAMKKPRLFVNADAMENIQFLLLRHCMVRKASILYDVLNNKNWEIWIQVNI